MNSFAIVVLPVPGNPTKKICGGLSRHAFNWFTMWSMPIKDVSIICDWNSILLLNTYAVVLGGFIVFAVFTVLLADLGGGGSLAVVRALASFAIGRRLVVFLME
jgi:hypothetical protein